jgi:hypothetical protein
LVLGSWFSLQLLKKITNKNVYSNNKKTVNLLSVFLHVVPLVLLNLHQRVIGARLVFEFDCSAAAYAKSEKKKGRER